MWGQPPSAVRRAELDLFYDKSAKTLITTNDAKNYDEN
jgi:hypothetical protein